MKQIPLHISLVENYFDEDFVFSKYNSALSNLLSFESWGVEPYPEFVLVLGRKSSGKTHFANMWQRKFSGSIIQEYEDIIALNKGSYCVIEDIEIMDPEEMFHIFNILHEKKAICLLTTMEYPFNSRLPDLNSRINSIRTIALDIPDYEMIRVFLIRQFKIRGINVSDEAIDYIAARVPYDFDQIINIVSKLDSDALSTKSKITIQFVKKLLEQL